MTTPPTTDLPAGPEMDLAVARACGMNAWNPEETPKIYSTHIYADGKLRPFKPSSDIADAFEALGVMGWHICSIVRTDRGYGFTILEDGQFLPWAGEADTIPHAICRAIVVAGKGGGG